jgi:hypothetical protein
MTSNSDGSTAAVPAVHLGYLIRPDFPDALTFM